MSDFRSTQNQTGPAGILFFKVEDQGFRYNTHELALVFDISAVGSADRIFFREDP